MRYVCNAFTPGMLPALQIREGASLAVRFTRISEDAARAFALGADSAVGHAGTAEVLSSRLGREVPCERRTLTLHVGDEVLIAQLMGPRLPEGRVLTAAEVSAVGITFILALVEQ